MTMFQLQTAQLENLDTSSSTSSKSSFNLLDAIKNSSQRQKGSTMNKSHHYHHPPKRVPMEPSEHGYSDAVTRLTCSTASESMSSSSSHDDSSTTADSSYDGVARTFAMLRGYNKAEHQGKIVERIMELDTGVISKSESILTEDEDKMFQDYLRESFHDKGTYDDYDNDDIGEETIYFDRHNSADDEDMIRFDIVKTPSATRDLGFEVMNNGKNGAGIANVGQQLHSFGNNLSHLIHSNYASDMTDIMAATSNGDIIMDARTTVTTSRLQSPSNRTNDILNGIASPSKRRKNSEHSVFTDKVSEARTPTHSVIHSIKSEDTWCKAVDTAVKPETSKFLGKKMTPPPPPPPPPSLLQHQSTSASNPLGLLRNNYPCDKNGQIITSVNQPATEEQGEDYYDYEYDEDDYDSVRSEVTDFEEYGEEDALAALGGIIRQFGTCNFSEGYRRAVDYNDDYSVASSVYGRRSYAGGDDNMSLFGGTASVFVESFNSFKELVGIKEEIGGCGTDTTINKADDGARKGKAGQQRAEVLTPKLQKTGFFDSMFQCGA